MKESVEGDGALEPPLTPTKTTDDSDLSGSRFQASQTPIKSKTSNATVSISTTNTVLKLNLEASTDSIPSTSLGMSIRKAKVNRFPSRQQNVTASARTILLVIGVVAFSVYGFMYSSVGLYPFGEEQKKGRVEFRFKISPKQGQQKRQILRQIQESARKMVPCLFDPNVVCRFDSVGKFLEDNPPIPNVVHRLLQSVPSHRRTPHDKANDRDFLVAGLSSDPNDRENSDATNSTLNEYNPTILPLYKTVIENGTETLISDLDDKLLDELTGRYHPDITDAQADAVKYLAVTRASNHYPQCVGFQKSKDKGYHWVNYPGLVLLDRNLLPIDGADVLIDIEKYYFTDRNSRIFQDFSIYAARTTKSNPQKDHLFLTTNGMFVIPIAIRRVPLLQAENPAWNTKITTTNVEPETMYGTGLQVRMTRPRGLVPSKVFLRLHPSMRVEKGKNMHFFESESGENYVEVWPYNTHSVREVDFFIDNFTSFENYDWKVKEAIATPDVDEKSSFLSEKIYFHRKMPENRGTGCCADLTLADGRQVKIGIAHSVLKGTMSYLHRFYAFVPKHPFQVIKLSGLFCLGHMQETDGDVQNHWLSKKDGSFDKKKSKMGEQTFDCPHVTFATGITNLVGHGNDYIIISYGVDDCYSRSIIVHKKKIELLMFPSKENATNVLYQ